MPLRDILKKKDKLVNDTDHDTTAPASHAVPDGFTFIRTDTLTEEVIAPPAFEDDNAPATSPTSPRRRLLPFRKASNASTRSHRSEVAEEAVTEDEKGLNRKRSLSQRLHLTPKSRSTSQSSFVPPDLPSIPNDYATPAEDKEYQWEERATILAQGSPLPRSRSQSPAPQLQLKHLDMLEPAPPRRPLSDAKQDETIQDAIRLHESGDLESSTKMFGRLAESGNVLSQVLYGLALRHGWGCEPDQSRAITYLSAAAANSAAIEAQALNSGMKKGGAAKGELVLAMFELANCFRHGWGIQKDPVAARQYYETAANLGDTDAMNEAAWCYLEGYGGKKDKFKAAQYLRQSEKSGTKILGNSWIWKEKYDPPVDSAKNGK